MNDFKIEYLSSVVENDIPRLPKGEREKIRRAIEDRLGRDPVAFGKPLQYSLKGCRRLRVGDYRIVFFIEKDRTVVIVKIGHRKDVYE
jgi:mRNA interferase RelE/StbE